MPPVKRISVVIPTRNECLSLPKVLRDLQSVPVTEVIVVDSNSTDGTPALAAQMGARVITEPRRGYGQACLTGLAHADSPDIVVFLDGDYSDRPAELPSLVAPIIENCAEITIGSRLTASRTRGSMPWHAVLGNRLAAWLINMLFRQKLTDLGPFRAVRADLLPALSLQESSYGWAVEMILKGGLLGYRIVEVPVSYFPRIGQSKISGTVRGSFGAAWFIFSRIFSFYFRRRQFQPSPARPSGATTKSL